MELYTDTSKFIITEFKNIFTASDPAGRRSEFKDRYAASFIITLSGSIAFHFDGGCVIADREHPVFLPRGLDYVNECTEDAYSLVFSFDTLFEYEKPCVLSPVSESFATECYKKIERSGAQAILAQLYLLAQALFEKKGSKGPVEKAMQYMSENYADPTLTVKDIATVCYVSEIYLRKLFERERGTTPFRALTDIRMERAHALALEKRPIKEISASVGYSDLYQFSRAYKKYFGFSPSKTNVNFF